MTVILSKNTDNAHAKVFGVSDTRRALSALHFLDPNCDHDTWIRIMMGSKNAGIEFEQFTLWSQGGDNYNAADCRYAWKSIEENGAVTAATLFGMARDAGWRDDGTAPPVPMMSRQPAPKEKPRTYAIGMSPDEVWSRCKPATIEHPYIVGKRAQGVPLDGLRVLPPNDRLQTVGGVSVAGALAVPAYGFDGVLQSIQFIPADGGKKMNLPIASMSGASFVVGEIQDGETVYLVEGLGTAWADWMATDRAAVVCFGWSNIKRIAQGLHQKGIASLVICPDVGKESAARTIAQELGIGVALMPSSYEKNADLWDVWDREGGDVVADILDAVEWFDPPTFKKADAGFNEPLDELIDAPAQNHPLQKFVEVSMSAREPEFCLDSCIEAGVVTIAGARGVGKTSVIVPLALVAAGLHRPNDPLSPRGWRHIIYVSEHPEQVMRILSGVVQHGNWGIDERAVHERFHLVAAQRMPAHELVKVGKFYAEKFTRNHDGVNMKPLVILDTLAATIDIENENDNAQGSKAVAALKQGFEGLPTWIICHIAKMDYSRKDADSLTARGAGSFESDAIQNVYIVKGDKEDGPDSRFMVLGKRRFEARFKEFEIATGKAEVMATNAWGEQIPTTLVWGVVNPLESSRHQRREIQAEIQAITVDREIRTALLDFVRQECTQIKPNDTETNPASQWLAETTVAKIVKCRRERVKSVLEKLAHEGWIHTIDVPSKRRINAKKSSFLIALSAEEKEVWDKSKILPATLTEPTRHWAHPSQMTTPLSEDMGVNQPENEARQFNSVLPHSVLPLKEKRTGQNGTERKRGVSCDVDTPAVITRSANVHVSGAERGRTGQNGTERDRTEIAIIDNKPSNFPIEEDCTSLLVQKTIAKTSPEIATEVIATEVALGDSSLSENNQADTPDAVVMDAPAPDTTAAADKPRKRALDSFNEAMNAVGVDGVLSNEAWRNWMRQTGVFANGGSFRQSFSHAKKRLLEKGLIVQDGDSFRRAGDATKGAAQ
jgi:hypothetical protein